MTKQELMETYTAEQLAEMVVEFQSGKENKVFKVLDNKNYQKELEEFLKESPIQSTIDRICKDITEQKNNAMAMEFTRVICDLLRENGVYVHCTETKFSEKIKENSIEEKYGIKFDSVDFSEHDKEFTDKIKELQSEVEKYRKAFEDAKKERDCQIAEYQKKIEELTEENNKLKGDVDGMNYQEKQDKTNNFYGIYAHSAKNLTKDDLLMFLGILTKELTKNGIDFRYEMEKELKVWDIKIKGDREITDFLPTEPIKVADMLINAKGEYKHNAIAKALYKEDKGTYRIFDVSELRQIAEHLLVYCNNNGEAEE